MGHFVCPWWVGYLLISPLRRFAHDPERNLGPYLNPGMIVVDFGCGMGHFSLPMARMVGPSGRVVCVDLQARMLKGLRRRALKAGVNDRLETRQVSPDDSGLAGLDGQVDFILAAFVVHEVPDAGRLLRDFRKALKTGGHLLFAEPVLHVREREFLDAVERAEEEGLVVVERPSIRRARAALFRSRAA